MVIEDGRPTLHLDDPGGEPLATRALPWELGDFLRAAVSVVNALRQLHERGIVHRDIKPGNILVDDEGNAWLSGSGVAVRLPRAREPPKTSAEIVGTLRYMSPEQTGRVNRPVDARSDLYSLGIVFFEMLGGRHPFAATTPAEWIHCHVARSPDALGDPVPVTLAAIVAKLLANRYQTAAGLQSDLQRSLAELDSRGSIPPFAVAKHDAWDRLVVSSQLYGRRSPTGHLRAALDRVEAGGTELVLLSGYSGIGKSSLVDDVLKPVTPGGARVVRRPLPARGLPLRRYLAVLLPVLREQRVRHARPLTLSLLARGEFARLTDCSDQPGEISLCRTYPGQESVSRACCFSPGWDPRFSEAALRSRVAAALGR